MEANEYEVRNGKGNLICICRDSERPGDPDIVTKNGEIPYHEFQRKVICPEKKGRKGKTKKPELGE